MTPPRRLRTAVKVALAWSPFFILWVLFVRIFVGTELSEAVFSGAVAIGNAAVLGVGVWWLAGRYRWPSELRPLFYLAHIGLGSLYSVAWILMGHFTALAQTGEGTLRMLVVSSNIGWRFLMGLWLYGLVAGVSYSVRIARRLVEQQRIAARAQALAAEARLANLRAQLQPHFLFNALHSVRSLIRHDPAAARDAVERLGDMLRATLDDDWCAEIPLARELERVRDYLEIEKLRLGDRLAVETRVEPAADGHAVPAFVLQTLVENAVRHGISPSETGGRIRIAGRTADDCLQLTVSDDGPGATAVESRAGNGKGLAILRDRLHALYGDAASLDIETGPDAGFTAHVTIPRSRTRPKPPDVEP